MPIGKEGSLRSSNQSIDVMGIEIPKGALLLAGIGIIVSLASSGKSSGKSTLIKGRKLQDALDYVEKNVGVPSEVLRKYIMYVSGFNSRCHYNQYSNGEVRQYNDGRELGPYTVCGGLFAMPAKQARIAFAERGINYISDEAAMKAFVALDPYEQLSYAIELYRQYGNITTVHGLATISDLAFKAPNSNYLSKETIKEEKE